MNSQKITTNLWFDTQAKEAAEFYAHTFKDSKVTAVNTIHNTPSGDVDIVSAELMGQQFQMISAGPLFKFTPAVSFLVACATKEEVDRLWAALSEGGKPHMELGSYPFSERYGWTEDRYGLSWQIMFMGDRPAGRSITPTMMFVGDVCGRAEEAVQFYTSVFHDSKIIHTMRYNAGEEPDKEGTVRHTAFVLEGLTFAAMDSARNHAFTFNEAISFVVRCTTQEEIDYYWEKLSAHPENEQCGWLKDKFGFSWQIVPTAMDDMMMHGTPAQMAAVTDAFMKMKKFDIATLQKAFDSSNPST